MMGCPAAQISGKFNVDGSGNVDFKEEDGIDYAPVTVQMPGGERVPFLFTIKELQAKASPTPSSADSQLCTSKKAAPRRHEGHCMRGLLGWYTDAHGHSCQKHHERGAWSCLRAYLYALLGVCADM